MDRNPIAKMRRTIENLKDKEIVALMLIKRSKKSIKGEYAVFGNDDEKIVMTTILFETGNHLTAQLIKEGVLEEDNEKNSMYG
jgi:hypothetical protein